MTPEHRFYAHGKLLLSGEYFVLDGALALAIPTKYGQHLEVYEEISDNAILYWRSLDVEGNVWFSASFSLPDLKLLENSDQGIADTLRGLLLKAAKLNKAFLDKISDRKVYATTRLEFSGLWGLGSSSTLVANLAHWAKVDAFELQFSTFGGSGYDIACAEARYPLVYYLKDGKPKWNYFDFQPLFQEQLYFLYMGKKQDSREGIAHYHKLAVTTRQQHCKEISALTQEILFSRTLQECEKLMATHEGIVAKALGLPRVKQSFFGDYWGEVKSLGAWGGDFVLVTSAKGVDKTAAYFSEKGLTTLIPFNEMIYRN